MTMVFILGNRDQMILAADRRLSAQGNVMNDAYNKATVVNAPSGRVAIGFTGIATYKSFNIQKLLIDLSKKAIEDHNGDITHLPDAIAAGLTNE